MHLLKLCYFKSCFLSVYDCIPCYSVEMSVPLRLCFIPEGTTVNKPNENDFKEGDLMRLFIMEVITASD